MNFKKNFNITAFIKIIFIASCLFGNFTLPILASENREKENKLKVIIDRFKGSLIINDTILKSSYYPHVPPKNKISLIPKWKETSHFIVPFVFYPNFRDDYISIIRKVAPHTKIIFIVQPTGEVYLNKFLNLIDESGLFKYIENGNVNFIIANFNSPWLRDYGPFFATNEFGKNYIIDTYYDQRSLQNQRLIHRSSDDIIPTHILEFLRDGQRKITSIRPPIFLSGGDFFTAGGGLCFTSTNTLKMNGGDEDELKLIFGEYFGCEEIVYLKPLPGMITKHIDMFFKIVDERTILLGEYDGIDNRRATTLLLEKKAQRILNENKKMIEDAYSRFGREVSITRIPMPNINSRNGMHIYRTYINSSVIKNNENSVVILPRYEEYRFLEEKILDAYRKVYQNPEFIFMESDYLILLGGAIHCITNEIPMIKNSTLGYENERFISISKNSNLITYKHYQKGLTKR